jgi:hypothetical protein
VTFVSGAKESAPTVDHLLSTSQRSSALSLVAPGAWITSTWLNNGTQAMGGTSMATAVVAGSATLIHQAYDQTGKSAQATQDNILQLLKTTGVSIVDIDYGTDNVANTNLTFKRVNLKAAMDTIGQPVAPPTFAPIPNQTLPVGGTIVVPLKVTSPTGKPITFTWKQIYLPAQAYQLDQKHGFKYLGSYYQNSYGANEKWIIAANNIWHAILPNGEVRRWAGSMASTLTPANLVGTLDASYWSDPAKLWNAPYAGMPPAVFSLSGSNLSIRSPAFWLGTYRVVVTASDGTYQVQQGFNVNQVPANSAPVLSSIANQTMPHSQDKLTLNLSATDADQDPITFSAQVLPINGVTPAVSVSVQGNQLTVNPAASVVGTFTVQVNASDGKATTSKSFAVTVYNTAPTLGAIDDQTSSHGPETVLTLNGTDADGDVLTYSAQVLSVNGQTPPIQATINGNQLTLHATEPIVGTYAIATTVSDGAASATRAFNLILTNTGPTFAAVSPQTMANGQTSSTFTLPVNDADNDTLSFQAVVQTPDAAAYQLNQQYAFKASNASYYFNTQGASEKWVIDKNKFWYAIMPTGKVHRWNHSMTQTLTAANLVATLDPSVYAEPRLLWNANPPVTPPLTISFQGNQMTIERPASLTGVFFLDVTVSDGWLTAKRTIQVTLN